MFKSPRFLGTAHCLGLLCLSSFLALAVLATASDKAAEKQSTKKHPLRKELEDRAPQIREVLWGMDHPPNLLRVGVLKFLVQIGDDKPSDNVGPLNWSIARRLEAALILTLDDSQERKFRLLHIDDPEKQVNPKANHQKGAGHRALFFTKGTTYPTAWGRENEKLPADVFLTGLVQIAEDARSVKVKVQAFDKTSKDLKEICTFPVAAQPSLLAEAGVSFALSRDGDANAVKNVLASLNQNEEEDELPPEAPVVKKKAKGGKSKEGPTVHELLEAAPLDFQIYYQKGKSEPKLQSIKPDGTVEEPTEDTKVTFRVKHKNKDGDQFTYGVVLRINGANTIYPEERELNNFRAYKWIVAPKADYEIKGFRTLDNKNETKEITVLPALESRSEALNYGLEAGTITVVIFQGRTGKAPPRPEESQLALGVARGVPDKLTVKPITLAALQSKLQEDLSKQCGGNGTSRGMMVPGQGVKQTVEEKEFYAYAPAVSTINLRYYKPEKEE